MENTNQTSSIYKNNSFAALVILGDSDRQVAEKLSKASKSCTENLVVLHPRAMTKALENQKDEKIKVDISSPSHPQ
jgi:hypothetical protein